MFPVKSCYIAVLLLGTCSILTQCVLDSPNEFSDNTDNSGLSTSSVAVPNDDKYEDPLFVHKRPSFFVGSRYGRSGVAGNSLFASSKSRRLNVVPRNDRFFLGSRYGKRAGEYSSPYEQSDNDLFAMGTNTNGQTLKALHSNRTPYMMMSCVFVGGRNLYRCTNVDEINNIINQLTTAQTDEDTK